VGSGRQSGLGQAKTGIRAHLRGPDSKWPPDQNNGANRDCRADNHIEQVMATSIVALISKAGMKVQSEQRRA